MKFVALLALGLVPPLVLVLGGFSAWQWVLLGAGAWAVAVVVKAGPGAAIWWAMEKVKVSPKTKSGLWGAWSAVCELGVTAVVFVGASTFPSILDAVGFGVGAGGIEALVVLLAGITSSRAGKAGSDSDNPVVPPAGFVAWSGVLERALASTGHVASRGLIWVGIQARVLAPAVVVAWATFAVVDGLATYGSEVGWDWEDADRLKWFYAVVAVVTAVEVAAFVVGVVALRALFLGG